jgi:hypothetical protein
MAMAVGIGNADVVFWQFVWCLVKVQLERRWKFIEAHVEVE